MTTKVPKGRPGTKIPPRRQPIGTVTKPYRIPRAKSGRSSFSIIPKATGIVKTMVGPIIEPIQRQRNFLLLDPEPTESQRSSSHIIGNEVVAKIDGSAPTKPYKGTTIGFKTSAKRGAITIIPAIDRAKAPIP